MQKKHWQWLIAYVAGGLTFGYVIGLLRGARR
jgi:hypothetical protein